jgi:hypothetical protein
MDVVATARAIWRRESLEAIRTSPLGGIDEWLRTGAPPPAEALQGTDRYLRKGFVHAWGCSIPCLEAVEALSTLGPLVEVAAGTGYWSRLLASAGCDVVATDLKRTHVHDFDAEWGRYFPVETLDAAAAVATYPDRSAFCSWPTLGTIWPLEAARMIQPGLCFAMISELPGGMAPAASVFDYLAEAFDQVATVAIPQFPPHADALRIWRKR